MAPDNKDRSLLLAGYDVQDLQIRVTRCDPVCVINWPSDRSPRPCWSTPILDSSTITISCISIPQKVGLYGFSPKSRNVFVITSEPLGSVSQALDGRQSISRKGEV